MSKMSAVYALNNYVFKVLEANSVMAKINGMTPIIPSSMESDFASQPEPFIIYGHSKGATRDMYFWEHENIAYTIWAGTPGKVTDIVTVLDYALGRHDDAAGDVNAWINGTAAFEPITFTNISTLSAQGPSPEKSENGKVSGLVVVSYSYIAKRDSILTRF